MLTKLEVGVTRANFQVVPRLNQPSPHASGSLAVFCVLSVEPQTPPPQPQPRIAPTCSVHCSINHPPSRTFRTVPATEKPRHWFSVCMYVL